MPTLADLVEGNDLDGLIRYVDRSCSARDWDAVVEMRDRCLEAVERGKQLWPAAQFAEYRLALEAPAAYAGPVVREGAGRFTLGPLWEVAASTHGWEELADAVPDGPPRTLAAHERVVRGDDLRNDPRIDRALLDVPLCLEPWEPRYPVAVYRADKADFPDPPAPELAWVELPTPPDTVEDLVATDALYDLVRPWVEQSNGRCETRAVHGTALDAVAAFGLRRVRVAELDRATALAYLAWTGASGGAYGRRRGTPVGRYGAWWAVTALAGIADDWPVPPAEIAAAADELRWLRWDPGDQTGGWSFHLAVEDPDHGLAWAVTAVDAV